MRFKNNEIMFYKQSEKFMARRWTTGIHTGKITCLLGHTARVHT